LEVIPEDEAMQAPTQQILKMKRTNKTPNASNELERHKQKRTNGILGKRKEPIPLA
jgi:hypothetical protein